MPVFYPVLSLLPAPEDFSAVQLAVEIDQPVLEPLEHAPDLLQLEQVVLDLARDRLDGAAQVELLLRLVPSTTTIVDLICVSFASSCSIRNPSSSVSGVTTAVSVRTWSSAEHSLGSCPAATQRVTMSRSEMVPR